MIENSESLALLFWLLFPLVVIAALVAWLWASKRRQVESFHRLASERGWHCVQARGLFGQSAGVTFTPQEGSDWSLHVKTMRTTRRNAISGHTEFHATSPVFRGGFLLVTAKGPVGLPGLEKGLAALQRGFACLAGPTLLRGIYSRDQAEHMHRLRAFEAPAGLNLAIQASADPRQAFDLGVMDRLVNGTHGMRPNYQISVMIGTSGLRVSLEMHGLREPAEIDAFVTRCLRFRRELMRDTTGGE